MKAKQVRAMFPRTLKTLEERRAWFWGKVSKTDSCWIWTDCKTSQGYGRVTINIGVNKKDKRRIGFLAHRFAYEFVFGQFDLSLMVCHACDNTSCVNPSHLFLGDAFINQTDSSKKKRGVNSRKTHCKRGHEYSDENTAVMSQGRGRMCRRCKICMKAWPSKNKPARQSGAV